MHRLLFGEENIPAKMEIDHINGKPYDNRRSNLRLVTHADNMKNQAMRADNKSGYADVWENKGWGKPWTAQITCNGIRGITLAILILQKKLQKQWLQNENDLLLSSHEHRRICSMVHGGHANAELP